MHRGGRGGAGGASAATAGVLALLLLLQQGQALEGRQDGRRDGCTGVVGGGASHGKTLGVGVHLGAVERRVCGRAIFGVWRWMAGCGGRWRVGAVLHALAVVRLLAQHLRDAVSIVLMLLLLLMMLLLVLVMLVLGVVVSIRRTGA